MTHRSPDVNTLVRNLVRYSGRDPIGYEARVMEDGSIAVRSATTAVYYPLEGWMSKFSRHLYQGFFEAPEPAVPSRPRPG